MNPQTLIDKYRTFREDDLTFIYQGNFSDKDTDKIIDLNEINIGAQKSLIKLRKKVSFLMAESFQNIVRHKTEASDSHLGFFLTRSLGNTYYITSGNPISEQSVEGLRNKLNHLNELETEEIKELYLELLSEGEFNERGGAGLGMIEIARRSGQKLEFDFERLNQGWYMFYLQICLKNKSREFSNHTPLSLDLAKEIHYQVEHENVFMIYKGDFSQDSIMPVLKMTEENLKTRQTGIVTKKRVFLILVEMLQNISKYGEEKSGVKEGIFMLTRHDNGQYSLSAGNLTTHESALYLKKKLDNLVDLDSSELHSFYKQILQSGERTQKSGAGLGLIDIVRKAERVQFEIYPHSGEFSFFAISARV